jgi:hypothetical protein
MGQARRPTFAASAAFAAPILKNVAWRAMYRQWPRRAPRRLEPGYTVILPVPGDLPVFFRLALANVIAQDSTDRAGVVVVPDRPSRAIRAEFEARSAEMRAHRVRLTELPAKSRLMGHLTRGDPATNYFLQLHAAAAGTSTTHALLHDADLFLTDRGFLARHYRRCAERGLACLGVSAAWDDWLRDHGCDHVVATWELMFDMRWLRWFRPWRHRSHFAWKDSEWHGFDVMLATQAKTPPSLCELHPDAEDSFIHFNWVIGEYRHFQRSDERSTEDSRFVILLIRLLVDALGSQDGADSAPDVPDVEQLARGLSDGSQRVTYVGPEAAGNYADFQRAVRRLYDAPLFHERAAERIERALAPFDAALG